jgi:hypothetical protein
MSRVGPAPLPFLNGPGFQDRDLLLAEFLPFVGTDVGLA